MKTDTKETNVYTKPVNIELLNEEINMYTKPVKIELF